MSSAHASFLAAALAGELTESQASFRIFLAAGGLAILGSALLLFTIWWWRGTKPEPPALGPLEVMSDRRWYTASDSERRRLVETNRPDAEARLAGTPAPVPIDLSVLARDQPSGFDDLRDDPTRWPYGPSESSPSADGSVLGLGSTADDDDDDDADDEADDHEVEGQVAVDDGVIDDTAVDPAEPLVVEAVPSDVDDTMYQVEAPSTDIQSSNGSAHFDDHHHDHDQDDQDDQDEPSGEMVIDPLLQRTASLE